MKYSDFKRKHKDILVPNLWIDCSIGKLIYLDKALSSYQGGKDIIISIKNNNGLLTVRTQGNLPKISEFYSFLGKIRQESINICDLCSSENGIVFTDYYNHHENVCLCGQENIKLFKKLIVSPIYNTIYGLNHSDIKKIINIFVYNHFFNLIKLDCLHNTISNQLLCYFQIELDRYLCHYKSMALQLNFQQNVLFVSYK
jgi:hypothetical protein